MHPPKVRARIRPTRPNKKTRPRRSKKRPRKERIEKGIREDKKSEMVVPWSPKIMPHRPQPLRAKKKATETLKRHL